MMAVSILVMIISLVFMALNAWVFPMPDWVVRVIGMVMLVDLTVFVFLFVRTRGDVKTQGGA